jgi:hypothetical protein
MVPNLRVPQVGDPVVWFPDGNTKLSATSGTVIVAGENAIDISVLMANGGRVVKSSVWHIRDEQPNDFIRKQSGGWDYAPWFIEVLEIPKQVAEWMRLMHPEDFRSKVAREREETKRKTGRTMSEEQKQRARENLEKARAARSKKSVEAAT